MVAIWRGGPIPQKAAPALYHITHVSNIASIATTGAIWSYNKRQALGIRHVNIAHSHIRERRASRIVEGPQGGSLNDYVPFYFAPRSPMLFVIHKGGVQGYQGGQKEIVHVRVQAREVDEEGISWVFTDGHAEMDYATFYSSLDDLDKIDWPLMVDKFWGGTAEDPNRTFRRQAEFLVHQGLPWRLVRGLAVIDHATAARLEEALKDADHKPEIEVKPTWYY
jgi:hypothetical protein